MDNLNSWKIFESTGKIEDYLRYAEEKRLGEARESFISAISSTEGEKNGRNNNDSGNGNFFNGYK